MTTGARSLLRFLVLTTSVVGALVLAGASRAEAQGSAVAPYFMLIIDTSGSMTSSTGSGNNSCGQPHTRGNDAKCVAQQVVNAYGDVNFGLATFNTTCTGGTCAAACETTVGGTDGVCNCTGCGLPSCNDGDDTTASAGRVLVPIIPENQSTIVNWVDFSCSSCTATTGAGVEMRFAGNTPLMGTLRTARRYFMGMDPTYGTSPIASDPFIGCRPVRVILLTDGAETCGGTPSTAATELRATTVPGVSGTVDIRTYVIGLGIAAGNAEIESIANAGGTDAPGVNRGFYAADETSLALAFSQIVADSIRVETCNNADDDCDTRIDEGFTLYCNRPTIHPAQDLCMPPAETLCDSIDNNCDGRTDEGLRNACGTCGAAPVETCNRIDDDCDLIIDEGVCGGCVPTVEICNGVDDDCNGTIDNITRGCGTDVGECVAGMQVCTAGTWGTCTGVGPAPEACNNRDDDCDGVIDGQVQSCGTDVGECQAGSQICMAGTLGPCIGAIGTTAERCDTLDNDCDTRIDEGNPGGGGACGSSLGICRAGTLACVAGGLTCMGGTSGTMEACNTLDDDCDGRTDEGDPGGGATCGTTDVGECSLGNMRCVSGALTCIGAIAGRSELCNTLDDDCDALIDEGNPEGGMRCGDDTGECMAATTTCTSGVLMCTGAIGPTMEICNALDDDCNGVIDDGIPVGAACGTDVGECDPGVYVCDTSTGMLVCSGEAGPTDELCDLLDNDCDGAVDEAMGAGPACGSDVGECMAGNEQCVGGMIVCVGEAPPATEICDCDDNDCDGDTDEPPPSGDLCPSGSACISCQCAGMCMRTEFGWECPSGTTAFEHDGSCHCVAPACDDETCGMETHTNVDGDVVCAPDTSGLANCICRNNACTFSCDGVTCAAGLVCDPRTPEGTCVEDNCRGLGCPSGQICNTVTGGCDADPCDGVDCAADEACRAGTCEATCAGVTCPSGQLCRSGDCVDDLCDGVTCTSIQACDPATGDCVMDMCEGVRCPSTQICDPVTGECEADPCDTIHCPTDTVCEGGECVTPPEEVDAGVPTVRDAGMGIDAGTDDDGRTRVLASGGGGCLCAAAGGGEGASSGLVLLLGVLGAVIGRRRRSRRDAGGAR